MRIPHTRVRALCCICGQVRTVSTAHSPRKFDLNHAYDDTRHPEGWRSTQTLRCDHCETLTRHATLRDELPVATRNKLEAKQMGWA